MKSIAPQHAVSVVKGRGRHYLSSSDVLIPAKHRTKSLWGYLATNWWESRELGILAVIYSFWQRWLSCQTMTYTSAFLASAWKPVTQIQIHLDHNNRWYSLSMYQIGETIPSSLHLVTNLILTTALWGHYKLLEMRKYRESVYKIIWIQAILLQSMNSWSLYSASHSLLKGPTSRLLYSGGLAWGAGITFLKAPQAVLMHSRDKMHRSSLVNTVCPSYSTAPRIGLILLFYTTGNALVYHTVMCNMLSNYVLNGVEEWDSPALLCFGYISLGTQGCSNIIERQNSSMNTTVLGNELCKITTSLRCQG